MIRIHSIPTLAAFVLALALVGNGAAEGPGARGGAGGSLLWEDVFDFAGGDDVGFSVASHGHHVFVAGNSRDAAGDAGFLIRAYDAYSGALRWQDSLHLPGTSFFGIPEVVTHGRWVYAAGWTLPAAGDRFLIVRAYDGHTGDLLWSDQHNIASGFGANTGIATDGKRVYLAGSREDAPGNLDFYVRAYHAWSGILLWEDVLDHAGLSDVAYDVQVQRGHVYAAGHVATPTGRHEALLRKYDARTGALIWQDIYDLAGFVDHIREIAVRGRRIYGVGFGRNAAGFPNEDLLIRAYDARTGDALWQDQLDFAGGSDFTFLAELAGHRVFAAGRTANSAGNDDLLVRAYDARSGGLLWQDVRDESGGFDTAQDIVGRGKRLYAVGHSETAAGNRDLVVLAYDAATGDVVWQDQWDGAGQDDSGLGADLHRNRLFITGATEDAAGNRNWLVRAYRAKSHHHGHGAHH